MTWIIFFLFFPGNDEHFFLMLWSSVSSWVFSLLISNKVSGCLWLICVSLCILDINSLFAVWSAKVLFHLLSWLYIFEVVSIEM